MNLDEIFRRFAIFVSGIVGSSKSFMVALLVIAIWGLTGPTFGFSNTWQLIINTGTTIVTFLTVFLIQNTQNRDARAMQLKLDELLKSMKGARNKFVNIEEISDDELDDLQIEFRELQEKYHEALQKREARTKSK